MHFHLFLQFGIDFGFQGSETRSRQPQRFADFFVFFVFFLADGFFEAPFFLGEAFFAAFFAVLRFELLPKAFSKFSEY